MWLWEIGSSSQLPNLVPVAAAIHCCLLCVVAEGWLYQTRLILQSEIVQLCQLCCKNTDINRPATTEILLQAKCGCYSLLEHLHKTVWRQGSKHKQQIWMGGWGTAIDRQTLWSLISVLRPLLKNSTLSDANNLKLKSVDYVEAHELCRTAMLWGCFPGRDDTEQLLFDCCLFPCIEWSVTPVQSL